MADVKPRAPWKVGLMPGATQAFPRLAQERKKALLSSSATLTKLAEDYTFYTPAILYLKVRLLGREPFWDFIQETGAALVPWALEFEEPLFAGLGARGDESWNHVLFALEKADAEKYFKWVGTLAFNDAELGRLSRLRFQPLQLIDPLTMKKLVLLPDKLPLVDVTGFVIESNQGCCFFKPGLPRLGVPRGVVCTDQAYPDTTAFAAALRAEDPNPYRHAVEDYFTPEAHLKRVSDARQAAASSGDTPS